MAKDKIAFEVLEDGTISITTDKISVQRHVSADQLLKGVKELAGGKWETQKRKQKYAFEHSHGKLTHSH
jgi:hypothetical protein